MEIEIIRRERDLAALSSEHRRMEERDEILSLELEQMAQEESEITEEEKRSQEIIEAAEARRGELEASLDTTEDQVRDLLRTVEEHNQELTRLKVELAAKQERRDHFNETLRRLDSEEADLSSRLDRGSLRKRRVRAPPASRWS